MKNTAKKRFLVLISIEQNSSQKIVLVPLEARRRF